MPNRKAVRAAKPCAIAKNQCTVYKQVKTVNNQQNRRRNTMEEKKELNPSEMENVTGGV